MDQKRVIFKEVATREIEDGEIEVSVMLTCKKNEFIGKIVSPNTQQDHLRGVAHSTIQALNQLLNHENGNNSVRIKLFEYRTMVLPAINQIVFVVVTEFIEHDALTYISGSSLAAIKELSIEPEALQGVARATLNAVNRKLSKYIQ